MSLAELKESVTLFYQWYISTVYPRILEMMQEPLHNKDLLWIVAPLVIAIILMQVYFGRHKEEELGWNSAYQNSIALIFVLVNLLREIYLSYDITELITAGTDGFYKVILVLILSTQFLALMLMDFTHLLPKKLAFFLSNSVVVNITAFVVLIIVHSAIPFDTITLYGSISVLFAAIVFFKIFVWLIPPTREARQFLQREKRRIIIKNEVEKAERTEKIKQVKESWNKFMNKK